MDDVPPQILDRLSAICLALPEAYEEPAWTGVRWRVRTHTFAHVRTIASDGETVTRMTFRAPAEELDALANAGPPYYRADWGRDVVGLVFGPDTDWAEVAELMTESFCVMAPQKLIARLDRPAADDTLDRSHTRQNG